MYYLQSRYYDPELGRFINADTFASTGQGILGNNMFAYCNNTPVNQVDPIGAVSRKAFLSACLDPEGNSPWITPQNTNHYGKYGSLGKSIEHAINNSNEEAVINADYFAFYKGALIVKVPFMETSAFSYGVIFMGSDVKDPNLVRHEYGHTLQLDELGFIGYNQYVILPSVTCFHLTQNGILPRNAYYSLPWEYVANMYGNADGYYTAWADSVAKTYWFIVNVLSN